jgi:glutamine amidotransferase-like uncharacterized protein
MISLSDPVRRYTRSRGPRRSRRQATGRPTPTPVALVYRGPASTPGCPEAAAELLSASGLDLQVAFIGPKEKRSLNPASFADATLYVQPGGPDLDDAYRHLRAHSRTIRGFVAGGGHYLGICLGGYLAGTSPGFALIPGDSDQYIKSPSTTVHTEEDAVVEVNWRGSRRTLYFQDGPCFQLDPDVRVTVLARYPNDTVAAAVNRFGNGRVGVVGPHPEADEDWFTDVGLPDPGRASSAAANARGRDLGLDLLNEIMRS